MSEDPNQKPTKKSWDPRDWIEGLRPKKDNGEKPPESNKQRFPTWLVAVLLAALVGWYVYQFATDDDEASSSSVPYSVFVTQVESGNVSEVTIGDTEIDAVLAEPIFWDSENDVVVASDTGDSVSSLEELETTIPPIVQSDNNELLSLLEENDVIINGSSPGSSFWTSLLFSFLPFLLFLGLLLFMGRQMTRGQQNVFGFGRSKARQNDPERPQVTFADVAGEEEAKRELTEVVDFLRNPQKYHQLGARLPRGVLLVGPPGTGKTLMAKAAAGEAGVPFFSISASEFVEMFVGVGASRVRDLFEKAKAASPAIVFIDEMDAVGRQRFAGIGGSNDEREQTLNQLLVEMDGFDTNQEVIVMAATNRPDVLDPALLRPGRFDRQVVVGLPNREGREAILRIHTRGLPLAGHVDLNGLAKATTGFSGADLSNLVNEAALNAARKNKREIENSDFDEALDKALLGTVRSSILPANVRNVVAHHEAGHALVAHFTLGTDPLRKVTIVPRGQALGVVIHTPEEDQYNVSRAYLKGRLDTLLGGRAAEKVVFDEITTGAENDLKQATSLARRMIGLWGMSDEVGPVYLGTGEEHVFLGREIVQERAFSDATATRLDSAIRTMIEESLHNAEDIVTAHRDKLVALVAALLEHETLDAEQVLKIFGPKPGDTAVPQDSAPVEIAKEAEPAVMASADD